MKVCKKGLDFKLFQDRESLGWGAEENLWRTYSLTVCPFVWLTDCSSSRRSFQVLRERNDKGGEAVEFSAVDEEDWFKHKNN